ncbi:SAM35 [Candida pseudojiufengensis]|uniref:SAM35 n=1 Tax=Candida pseudojiufengensis TaxID=497109 RepID=UPI002225B0D6|nr:SAM35 [Candida pseudojiufengensis]KAI5962288.1 SAM35 [Candida pseudojiufengensis]
MKIPQILDDLFDSVPLKIIHESDNDIQIKSPTPLSNSVPLILGVYNTFHYKDIELPTDPISLATYLRLIQKNDLKLTSSSTGLTKIPFRGSPYNSLPILIGDSIESIQKIQKNIAKHYKGEEFFINDFLDTKLYNLWITCLLTEKFDDEIYHKLFDVKDFEIYDLKKEIPNWNDFKVRYPSLNLKKFYNLQLNEFTEYMDLDNLKLASFIIIINEFLPFTEIGKLIPPEIVERSYKVLNNS